MSSGKLSFSNTKFISEEEHKILSARCCPEYGDLLISKVGTTGIPLIIDTDKEFSIFVSLALIKFFPNHIDSKFLIHLINSPLVQEQVKRDTRGVGNKNWVLTAISNTLLAIPPLLEQKRIVSKIEEIMPIADKYEKSQEALDRLNTEIYDKLKKSVLQEAIQGKLVPQDPNDEPASKLLERIKAEKTKLFKEGKLKKKDLVDSVIFKGEDNKYYERIDGNLLDISDEVPFDLPDSWVWARLSSVCNMFTGNSISEKDKSTYFTGVSGMQYIGTKDVRFDNSIDYKNGIAIPDTFLPNFKIAPSGSVLMCIEGGSAGRKVGQTDRDVCFGNKLCCFSSFGVYQRYLYYYIQSPSFVESFQKNKTGIIGGVSVNSLKNLLIAIPPIKEQVRIAQHVAETLSCL